MGLVQINVQRNILGVQTRCKFTRSQLSKYAIENATKSVRRLIVKEVLDITLYIDEHHRRMPSKFA